VWLRFHLKHVYPSTSPSSSYTLPSSSSLCISSYIFYYFSFHYTIALQSIHLFSLYSPIFFSSYILSSSFSFSYIFSSSHSFSISSSEVDPVHHLSLLHLFQCSLFFFLLSYLPHLSSLLFFSLVVVIKTAV